MDCFSFILTSLALVALVGSQNVDPFDLAFFQPEMIHISVNGDGQTTYFTWSSWNNTFNTNVQYGKDLASMDGLAIGGTTRFEDDGVMHRQQYIHRVEVTDMEPDTVYYYRVGSDQGWSNIYWLKTMKQGTDWKPRLVIYGDLGNDNAQSLPRLQQETQAGYYDMIIHIGDFAYDFHDDNGRVGDEFMTQIETIAAYVPYMVCPGNHEDHNNFSHYKNRFTMPDYEETENLFYSYNVGPIHFISLDNEAYYYPEYGYETAERQFNWLIQDLQEANEPANRAARPWVIVLGHRPMYCSAGWQFDDCLSTETLFQTGLPGLGFGIEEELMRYNVDLAFWAHEHNYERIYPIFNYTIMKGSEAEPYVNPRAPVHITTGSAGNDQELSTFDPVQPDFTAFRALDYGFTRLVAHNATHLEIQQVSDDKDGEVIDHLWIVSDNHDFGYDK